MYIKQSLSRIPRPLIYAGAGLALLLLALALWLGLSGGKAKLDKAEGATSLPDTLRVVTLSGATTYFTIQQEEMGYQYELLRLYAEHIGKPFTLEVVPTLESLHQMIEGGRAQLSITPEPITKEGRELWRFTGPSEERSMVLVQRKPKAKAEQDSLYVKNVTELIGKPIYTLAGTHYEQRLHNLGEQLGQSLDIRYATEEDSSAESLIASVATDSIDYAIVESEIARLAHTYYPNIDYQLEVGFAQRLRWITTKENELLAQSLDKWAENLPNLERAKSIYRKYFEVYKVPVFEDFDEEPDPTKPTASSGSRAGQGSAGEANYVPPTPQGFITPFDDLFKANAGQLPWSWHLLAAIGYQESGFRPNVVAWSGARGLMGIMPATGLAYGVSNVDELLRPEVSINVSQRCLVDIYRIFSSIPSAEDRLCFTLAGYNAGAGHVQDAQRLTKKYGGNPQSWAEVEHYILLKSEKSYYSDPVCKHGYLRGKETYNYVREVRERYRLYRHG